MAGFELIPADKITPKGRLLEVKEQITRRKNPLPVYMGLWFAEIPEDGKITCEHALLSYELPQPACELLSVGCKTVGCIAGRILINEACREETSVAELARGRSTESLAADLIDSHEITTWLFHTHYWRRHDLPGSDEVNPTPKQIAGAIDRYIEERWPEGDR